MVKHHRIIIVGGGPAGLGTALWLDQLAPELASDTLILEAQSHPRFKLCGGGVTVHGEEQLQRLGITIDAPAFTVDKLVFRLNENRAFTVAHPDAMRIYERAQFDAALARATLERGLRMQTNERLLDIHPVDNGVILTTDKDEYHARVVVAADGANSTVRRKLKMFNTVGVARLLRIMTPVEPSDSVEWQENTAIFDFTCIKHDIQGYMWDFPCYVDGQAHMNRGIFDSRILPQPAKQKPNGNLKQAFISGLEDRHMALDDSLLKGHPVRWFNPQADFAIPHVLLTGDAAGVDPLFAEGISYAMEYGEVAAHTIKDAFQRGDFAFTSYRERILKHRLGRLLMRRTLVARYLYGQQYGSFWGLVWRLASIAPLPLQRQFGAALALLPR